MEIFEMFVGIVMIYAWVHSLVILSKKLVGLTTYEKVVTIAALVGIVLFVIGALMG